MPPDEEGTTATVEPPAEDTLGEEGVKALEAWKQRAKSAEAEAKRVKQLEGELEKLRELNQTEAEKALEAARKEGAQAAESEWGTRYAKAQLELAVFRNAGTRFADPEDALRFLDLDEVTKDGNVDPKALTKAVDDLLAAKPYLAVQSGTPTAPSGPRSPSPTEDMNQLIRRTAGR